MQNGFLILQTYQALHLSPKFHDTHSKKKETEWVT